MPEEISDDELRTLLSSVGKKGASQTSVDTFAKTPLAYDFKRPQRVSTDQLRTLENIHEQFARLFSSSLASSMRMVVDVALAFIDQALYSEFVLSLPSPCSAYSFVMDPPGNNAVLSFAPELMMAIVDRAFGGKGTSYVDEARALTPIEINIVNKLVSRIFQDLEATWEIVSRIAISDITLENNPEFIQCAAAGDPVLLLGFEANSNQTSGLIHLCYPLVTLEPLLPKLTPEYRQQGKRHPQDKPPVQSRALDKVKVPVTVQVANGTLPLKELATLQAGDVIKRDTTKEEPAVVFLGNQPKFLGKPGLDGKRRAVKLSSVIPEDDEELYR